MSQVKVKLNKFENAKVEKLRDFWGLKSKEKAIKKAIMKIEEGEKGELK